MNTGSFKGLQEWHQSGDFERIIDLANEKYMTAHWREMGEWAPQQVGTQWNLKVDNIQIITLPSLGAPYSDGKQEGAAGFKAFSGTMPRMLKASKIDSDDLRTLAEYEYEGNGFVDELRAMYLKKAENMLGAFHLQLQSWMYEALTSGKISVTKAMGQGLAYEADFQVPADNKKTVATKWFESGSEKSGSDPIKDLQDMVAAADAAGAAYDKFMMSKSLYDKFITHSQVIKAVSARISDNTNYKPTRAEFKLELANGFDIPPIEVVDEKTFIDKNGKVVDAGDHFNKDVVVLCQAGSIFSVKNAVGSFKFSPDPNLSVSYVEDGRIGIRNRYDDRGLSEITDYELFAVPVLKNPNNLFIYKVR